MFNTFINRVTIKTLFWGWYRGEGLEQWLCRFPILHIIQTVHFPGVTEQYPTGNSSIMLVQTRKMMQSPWKLDNTLRQIELVGHVSFLISPGLASNNSISEKVRHVVLKYNYTDFHSNLKPFYCYHIIVFIQSKGLIGNVGGAGFYY